jgi:hypothetical protein
MKMGRAHLVVVVEALARSTPQFLVSRPRMRQESSDRHAFSGSDVLLSSVPLLCASTLCFQNLQVFTFIVIVNYLQT